MTNVFRKLAAGFVLAFFISLMLTCGAELSHGETDGLPRVVRKLAQQTNPNTSLVGTVLGGQVFFDEDGRAGTALRIHPKGMYSLFDQTVTFCGDVSEQVSTPDGRIAQGDLVFTYRRQSPRLINGVPCFELRSVDHILERRTFKP